MTGYKHTFLLLFWGLKPELQAWYTSYSTTELQSKHIFILRQAFQLGPFSKPHKSRDIWYHYNYQAFGRDTRKSYRGNHGIWELELIKDTSDEEELSFPKIHPVDWPVMPYI